jgi:hypothetical protein
VRERPPGTTDGEAIAEFGADAPTRADPSAAAKAVAQERALAAARASAAQPAAGPATAALAAVLGTATCPACGVDVKKGYVRCPKCHAQLTQGITRGAGSGTAVASRTLPWTIVALSVVATVIIVVMANRDPAGRLLVEVEEAYAPDGGDEEPADAGAPAVEAAADAEAAPAAAPAEPAEE